MIAEVIFSIIMGAISGYVVYKFKDIYDRKKRLKNIPEKMEKQDEKFVVGGKKIKKLDDKKELPKRKIEKKIMKEEKAKKKVVKKKSNKKKKEEKK